MLKGLIKETEQNLAYLFTRFLLNYIKYSFLTGSVVFSVAILLFILLSISPNISFDFFPYFSLINPLFKLDSFNIGVKEVMQIFSVVSLILMVVISLAKMMIKRLFHTNIKLAFKVKIITSFVIITLSYLLSLIIIVINKRGYLFYIIFLVFYIINLVSMGLYFVFDELLKKIVLANEKEPQM